MKIVVNDHIPFKGYKLMAVFPFVFVRREYYLKGSIGNTNMTHEKIHFAQQKELLLLFFYLWYGIEWLVRLVIYRNAHVAYRNISFEREAYYNENKEWYLGGRKVFGFVRYL